MDVVSPVAPPMSNREAAAAEARLRTSIAPLALGAALVGGLSLRLWAAWLPMPVLLPKTIPDDAFYYFEMARNILRGQGATFDGMNLTNGFHPLWLLVVLPIMAVAGQSATLPIHLALTLASCLDLVTGFAVYKLARLLLRRQWLAVAAAALYTFNPTAIFLSLDGLETSLATALFALCLLCAVGLERRKVAEAGPWLLLGLCGGLMILARTDMALIFAGILSGLLLAGGIPRLRHVLLAGAAATAISSPWFVWSFLQFGTPLQVSGIAVPWVAHRNFGLDTGHSGLAALRYSLAEVAYTLLKFLPDTVGGPALAFLAGVSVVGLVASAPSATRSRFVHQLLPLTGAIVGFFVMLLIHSAIRWYPRPWFFLPFAVFFALICAALVGLASERLGDSRWRSARLALVPPLALLVVAAYAQYGLPNWRTGLYQWNVEFYEGAMAVRQDLPPGAHAAGLDVGIVGYFSDRGVVNIDGVMNNSAFTAIEHDSLLAYLRQEHVGYLVDYDGAVLKDRSYGRDIAPLLQTVATVRDQRVPPSPYGDWRIWRIRRDPNAR